MILSLTEHASELQERKLCREAVAVMLHLIEDVSKYFCENAQRGAFGASISLPRSCEKLIGILHTLQLIFLDQVATMSGWEISRRSLKLRRSNLIVMSKSTQ